MQVPCWRHHMLLLPSGLLPASGMCSRHKGCNEAEKQAICCRHEPIHLILIVFGHSHVPFPASLTPGLL